jgi:ABC-type multidrug transport system ATPase subunit
MLVAGFTSSSSVVLLDEPLADLDDEGKRAVGTLARGWAEGGGLVICAAPAPDEAPAADRVVELRGGSLLGSEQRP